MAESDVTTFGQRIEVVGRPGSGGTRGLGSFQRGRHVDVGMARLDAGLGGVGSDSEPETALGSDSQPGHSPPYQSESRALEGSVFRIYGSQMMFCEWVSSAQIISIGRPLPRYSRH